MVIQLVDVVAVHEHDVPEMTLSVWVDAVPPTVKLVGFRVYRALCLRDRHIGGPDQHSKSTAPCDVHGGFPRRVPGGTRRATGSSARGTPRFGVDKSFKLRALTWRRRVGRPRNRAPNHDFVGCRRNICSGAVQLSRQRGRPLRSVGSWSVNSSRTTRSESATPREIRSFASLVFMRSGAYLGSLRASTVQDDLALLASESAEEEGDEELHEITDAESSPTAGRNTTACGV